MMGSLPTAAAEIWTGKGSLRTERRRDSGTGKLGGGKQGRMGLLAACAPSRNLGEAEEGAIRSKEAENDANVRRCARMHPLVGQTGLVLSRMAGPTTVTTFVCPLRQLHIWRITPAA